MSATATPARTLQNHIARLGRYERQGQNLVDEHGRQIADYRREVSRQALGVDDEVRTATEPVETNHGTVEPGTSYAVVPDVPLSALRAAQRASNSWRQSVRRWQSVRRFTESNATARTVAALGSLVPGSTLTGEPVPPTGLAEACATEGFDEAFDEAMANRRDSKPSPLLIHATRW